MNVIVITLVRLELVIFTLMCFNSVHSAGHWDEQRGKLQEWILQANVR